MDGDIVYTVEYSDREWRSIKYSIPPLNTMVEVQTLSYLQEVHHYATHFLSELEREHVLYKWRVTHWRKSQLNTFTHINYQFT